MGPLALILDSEAVNALAHARSRPALAERARAILRVAHEERALVRVPAPVLAEVCRGGARDAAVSALLSGRGIEVAELTAKLSRHAGALLEAAKMDSSRAVDAFVVATAASFGRALIATGDPTDLAKLAARTAHVTVFRI